MTDKIAVWVGGIIAAAVLFDMIFNGGNAILFTAKKGDEFIEWLAFWR